MTRARAVHWMVAVVPFVICAPPLLAQAVAPDAEGFVVAAPEELVPPEGGRTVNIIGNPREAGLYVIRITWEPGQGSRPHYHDQARIITVIEGTWHVSTGAASDVYDPDRMTPVEAGTVIYEPPNGHHYDMAKDQRVVVQITGMGPVNTTSIASSPGGTQ